MNQTDRKEIEQGLDDPEAMRAASQRALRLTMELNSQYYEPEEVRRRFFELICQPEDETFCLFPPSMRFGGRPARRALARAGRAGQGGPKRILSVPQRATIGGIRMDGKQMIHAPAIAAGGRP